MTTIEFVGGPLDGWTFCAGNPKTNTIFLPLRIEPLRTAPEPRRLGHVYQLAPNGHCHYQGIQEQ